MVYMLLAPGFEEVEALCPLDLLRRAGIEVKTVGVDGYFITGAHNITVKTDMSAAEFSDDAPEMVILPGGMPGTRNLDSSLFVDSLIRKTYERGAYLAAICAAPMVLGKRGMLAGKKAVCYPGFEKFLDGARQSSYRITRDGNIITAVGMGAALEFGLELIRVLRDDKTATDVAAAVLA